ncbi:MAG: Rieske (2Fe-2S) protein [Propionibacteriaceae bacterium]
MPDQSDHVGHDTTDADQPRRSAFSALVSNRRVLFHRAGLAALAGGGAIAVAACSNDGARSATPAAAQSSGSPAPDASASASGSASSAPSESAAPSASASAEPVGTKVAASAVPVGGGTVLPTAYVVTQPTAGDYKAFTNICTHQGCPVASVTDGQIVCNCHGSHFSITDGSPVSGPAQTPLAAKTVVESGANLYISG